MKDKNKIVILITGILAIVVIAIGVGFALFRFTGSGTNGELILGNIWMKYVENNGVALS